MSTYMIVQLLVKFIQRKKKNPLPASSPFTKIRTTSRMLLISSSGRMPFSFQYNTSSADIFTLQRWNILALSLNGKNMYIMEQVFKVKILWLTSIQHVAMHNANLLHNSCHKVKCHKFFILTGRKTLEANQTHRMCSMCSICIQQRPTLMHLQLSLFTDKRSWVNALVDSRELVQFIWSGIANFEGQEKDRPWMNTMRKVAMRYTKNLPLRWK